ncbi:MULTISPECIES: hypothetical protein, partial [unclassified Wenzhouxiangella]|uniref:hypothetical protein n=1 Tax=unclassified Wenzhouxiangella TaxID=2613841 RepID=UPI000E39139F
MTKHPTLLVLYIFFGVGVALIFSIYSLAWSGTLHFDDKVNLNGLQSIADWTGVLQFIFSGESGPTGRPLSLAT